jgi:DNA polymerase III subunit delta
MIYVLYGADDYSSKSELRTIKSSLGDPEMLAVNTTVLDGRKLNPEQLADVCQVVPFLHPVRLVMVEGLLENLDSDRRQKRNGNEFKRDSKFEEWQNVIDRLVSIPSTTILVFIDGEISSGNKILSRVMPLATVKTFPALQGENLYKWVMNKAKEKNGSFTGDAARTLIDYIGNDLWLMDTELNKLIAYKSGNQVTADDVRLLSGLNREVNIFALVDTILAGNAREAHGLLQRLFMEGNSASRVFTMISRQLRLIIIATEFSREMTISQMMEKLSVTSKWVLDKTIKQAKQYSLDQLRHAYHLILDADLSIKTSQFDDDKVVDLLVIELCQKKSM